MTNASWLEQDEQIVLLVIRMMDRTTAEVSGDGSWRRVPVDMANGAARYQQLDRIANRLLLDALIVRQSQRVGECLKREE